MYSWTLDRTLSRRMWRLMNDVLLILPVYFTYSCCLKKDFACLLEQRSKKIGQNVKGRSNFVLFNFALLSRLWRREVCKLCVDLLKIPAIFCLNSISSWDHHIMEYKEKCTKKSNLALCVTHELFIRLSWHYPQVWIVTPIFHIHLLLKKLLWQIFTKCRQIKGIYFLKKQILRQMMFRLS